MDGVTPAGNLVQSDDVQIATLRFEQEVDGVFACVRKERQISRAGTPCGSSRTKSMRDLRPAAACPIWRRVCPTKS